MKATNFSQYPAVFILALASTVSLVFNIVAISVFRDRLFLEVTIITGLGVFILAGFAVVLLFEVSMVIWSAIRLNTQSPNGLRFFPFSLLAILALGVSKVMIDEIGHEYFRQIPGEWIILYIALSVQLLFSLYVAISLAGKKQSQ